MKKEYKRYLRFAPEPYRSRFLAKILFTKDCWWWIGGAYITGYGHFVVRTAHWNKLHKRAHKLSYEWTVGSVPKGLVLDHLCRNKLCVRPAHLEPVTSRVNILRGNTVAAHHAAKTHCIYGHEFDKSNTWLDYNGNRHCKACTYRRNAEIRHRRARERRQARG